MKFLMFYRKFGIFAILLLISLIATILSPVFLTSENLINVIRQISLVTIVACAQTLLIISGMVDLSSGSVMALAGCIAVSITNSTGSAVVGLLSGIIVGGLTGLISGAIITKFDLPPFIVTLAMMTVARGGALLYTNGNPIATVGGLRVLGQGSIISIPIPVIILAIIAIITWLLLQRTKFGRYLFAIGGNIEAAKASGINVLTIKQIVFIISGVFTGLAGTLLMGRLNSGLPTAGMLYEFDAITGAIIGGTSFTGGIGTVFGTLIGSLILGIINNILNLCNVQSYYQQILKGVIIVIAVILDAKTKSIRIKAK